MGQEPAARTPSDRVLLTALRTAMGVSIEAADVIGSVSAVQLRAVTLLHQHPGSNLGELSRGMGVSVSVTSRLVDRLVAAGLVDKRASATSGREISLWLTEQGTATLERYDDLRLSRIRSLLQELPPERADAVLAALEALDPGPGEAG